MGAIHYKKATVWRQGLITLMFLLALNNHFCDLSAQPMLGLPKRGPDAAHAQIALKNCNGTNVEYVVQMSTNLTQWIPVATNSPSPTNTAIVPFTNAFGFYRVTAAPLLFPITKAYLGLVCKTAFSSATASNTIDSFDSSNTNYSTAGQYDSIKRMANAKIAVLSGYSNGLAVVNADVFGDVYTSGGAPVNLGPVGSVGDLNWVSNANIGIESGHWTSNFMAAVPDVSAPNTTGWATNFPPLSNGVAILKGGTNYVLSSLSTPLLISGPTVMWVKGSPSLGVTFTNAGSLILYVGNTTGSTSLSWSGQGTCNMPGYASNFQIYGLPGLTGINFRGVSGWVGTLYAPEAGLMVGGGGARGQDTSGAIVVDSLSTQGRWNFHYDESLGRP